MFRLIFSTFESVNARDKARLLSAMNLISIDILLCATLSDLISYKSIGIIQNEAPSGLRHTFRGSMILS